MSTTLCTKRSLTDLALTAADDDKENNMNPPKVPKSTGAERAANMDERAEVAPTADTAAQGSIDQVECAEDKDTDASATLDPRTKQAIDDMLDEARKDVLSSMQNWLETAAADSAKEKSDEEAKAEQVASVKEDKEDEAAQANTEEAPDTSDPLDKPLEADQKQHEVPAQVKVPLDAKDSEPEVPGQEETDEVVVAAGGIVQSLFGATEAQLVATGITEPQARRVHKRLQRNGEQTSWSDVRAATLSAKAVKTLQAAGYVLRDAGTNMLP